MSDRAEREVIKAALAENKKVLAPPAGTKVDAISVGSGRKGTAPGHKEGNNRNIVRVINQRTRHPEGNPTRTTTIGSKNLSPPSIVRQQQQQQTGRVGDTATITTPSGYDVHGGSIEEDTKIREHCSPAALLDEAGISFGTSPGNVPAVASMPGSAGFPRTSMPNPGQEEENSLLSDVGDQVVMDAVLKRSAMHHENCTTQGDHIQDDREWSHLEEETPQPLPAPTTTGSTRQATNGSTITRPGAYSLAPGADLTRCPTARFDLVGKENTVVEDCPIPNELDNNNTDTNRTGQQLEGDAVDPASADATSAPEQDEDTPPEATLIAQDSLRRAIPVDGEEQQTKKTQMTLLVFLAIGICFVAVVAAILGGILGTKNNNNMEADTILVPPASSSIAPTQAPSAAPTSPLDLLIINLPQSTLENLNNITTPQWKALDWLEMHPELTGMEEFRQQQLFALVTLYFAMEGPKWREDIQRRWLQYDLDECYWFSTEFGEFNFGTGIWEEQNRYNMTPCNQDGEFQLLDLVGLELAPDSEPYIPQEVSLLTSLQVLSLPENRINAPLVEFLPTQVYKMTNLTTLNLADNDLTGPIPSQLGLMTSMEDLDLWGNSLTGQIPTELCLITSMLLLPLHLNFLTGSIPTQLGLMTSMTWLQIWGNFLTGTLPAEAMTMLTSVEELTIDANLLTGWIPTQLASLTGLQRIWLNYNYFSGPLSSQLGLLHDLQNMWLDNNDFTGSIPQELEHLALDGSLESLVLHGNPLLEGTIPEALCFLGVFSSIEWYGLSFDCSEQQLCGCCWCPCEGGNDNNITITNCNWTIPDAYNPAVEDEEWPGLFPTPINTPNMITINIRTDEFPEETTWEWSRQVEAGIWESLDWRNLQGDHTLYSYTKAVESDATYRLRLSDRLGDGTCCAYGFGWFSITNSTPSADHAGGTVIWNATGEVLEKSLDIFVRADASGNAKLPRGYLHCLVTHPSSSIHFPRPNTSAS